MGDIKDTLEGERIILRKFSMDDIPAVYEYASDTETIAYLLWDGVTNEEEARKAVVDDYMVTPGIYAIALKENDICIGAIDIRIEKEHNKAKLGYVLDKRYWNQGYMSEALQRLLYHGFEDLGLQRIEAMHDKENIGSGKVMQKCGMRYEGIVRREIRVKGKYRDIVHYGILKEEFQVFCKVLK